MESHALLRINANEEHFLPVQIKVDWLSKQASMRSRARAMVGRRLSQLDSAIRVRALLSIIRSSTSTDAEETSPRVRAGGVTPGADSQEDQAETAKQQTVVPSPASPTPTWSGKAEAGVVSPRDCEEGLGGGFSGVMRRLARMGSGNLGSGGSRGCGSRSFLSDCPEPTSQDLEIFSRMAVSSMKAVLFQLASDEETKERGDKDLFDVYEGLLTTEALLSAAKEGFPSLNVETLMLPKHFRYRSLIAARHRFLLRKLGVLLDVEDDVESLLDLAADTESLRDSLADVDLSEEDASSSSSSASALASSSDPGADARVEKYVPTLQNTSWDKDGLGNEDATEGETDEETITPHLAQGPPTDVSPSH